MNRFCCLQHGQVSGLGALEDLLVDTAPNWRDVSQSCGCSSSSPPATTNSAAGTRGNAVSCGQRGELPAAANKARIDIDEQSADASSDSAEKAASISPSRPAVSTSTCCQGRPQYLQSAVSASAFGFLLSTSNAILSALGVISLASSSRLAPSTFMVLVTPVMSALGRLRLITRPALIGSLPTTNKPGHAGCGFRC